MAYPVDRQQIAHKRENAMRITMRVHEPWFQFPDDRVLTSGWDNNT